MTRPATLRSPLVVLVTLALAGCGHALGPEPIRTASVRGRLHLGGRSLGPGWLEMLPIEGTLGRLRTAPVATDGTFAADGVPVGRVAIRLAGRPLPPTGDPNVDRFLFIARRQNIIHKDIPAGPDAMLDLEIREAIRQVERQLREGS